MVSGRGRVPQRFGEIVLWLGIALMSVPVLVGWQLATLISPLYVIILLLTWVSGARILEARAAKKWAEDADYQSYKSSTLMVLWPPRRR